MKRSSVVPASAIPKQKIRRQIHQSGLEMLMKCGVQFEFRYILGRKRAPKTFLICGKATDKSITLDLDHKIDHEELENLDVLLDAARDVVEHYPDKEELEPEKDEVGKALADIIGDTKDKAVRLVKAHHKGIAPNIEPYATARKFSIDMDGFLRERARYWHQIAEEQSTTRARKVLHEKARLLNVSAKAGLDFVGEQDIVERFMRHQDDVEIERLAIRDSKTSKKSPQETVADESDQLTGYALASSVVDGKIPDAVILDYMIDLKTGTKTMKLEATRTQEHLDTYLERMANAVATIESGMYVPAPQQAWWCDERYCGFARECPYYRKTKRAFSLGQEMKGKAGKLIQISAQEAEG